VRNPVKNISLILLAVFILSSACGKAENGRTIRVALSRDDNVPGWSGYGFTFDAAEIATALEKYPTKFPDPLPEGGRTVMFYPGRVFGIIQKVAGKSHVLLTLDVNADRDLTDDAPIEIPKVEDWREGIIVKIARPFTAPAPHTEWLPYRISYEESRGHDGKVSEGLDVFPNYDYKGEFRLGEKDYAVRLYDGDLGGRFVREKQVNVNLRVGPKENFDKPGAVPYHRLFELIPIGDSLYEIKAIAEDGSWVEFAASSLTGTALGTRAPDLAMTDTAGQAFHISDYRGKVLVLDFWYVWCKPCIAKFPAIKKMIESYADKPLAAVGVNIDIPERVEQAKKVIADNQLTWRQVVEGKGEFLPVYQVYGRLPERPMSFPIYVAIDERGVTRYATNDFEKMGRFLDAHFNDPAGPENTLFVPLCKKYELDKKIPPLTGVDFSSPKARALAEGKTLKLPPGLPPTARVGRLPNGVALVAQPGPTPDKVRIRLDADGNSDLTNEKDSDVPVLDEPAPDESKMVKADCRIFYQNGAIGFGGFPFFARPAKEPGGPPDVYFKGTISDFAGTFFSGREEYRVELTDPNGDRLMTEEDMEAPGLLKLSVKKGDTWTPIHEGTRRIPIGRSLYRLRYVSDDGYLVELEKEK